MCAHGETEELWREAVPEPVGSGNKLEGPGRFSVRAYQRIPDLPTGLWVSRFRVYA